MSGSDTEVHVIPLSPNSDLSEREFVFKLIGLYRDNPVLWNPEDEHYTNKYKRIVALKKICEALRKYRPKYTIEEVKKKLNILRTNFNKERNKVELRKSIAPGENTESLQPLLWYYNEMSFLIGQQPPARRIVVSNDSMQDRMLRNLKRKRLVQSFMNESTPMMKKQESDEDVLAKYWAMKLRKLNPEQRMFAEKIINDTLFEGEMGTLTRHGVNFNTNPTVWTEFATESQSPVYKSPPS